MSRPACIVMASGQAKRFGRNKLVEPFCGVTLLGYTLQNLPREAFSRVLVVTRWPEAAAIAREMDCEVLLHGRTGRGEGIALAMERLAGEAGWAFCQADQPLVSPDSWRRLCAAFAARPGYYRLAWRGEGGSPALFPASALAGLRALGPQQGGGAVLRAHEGEVRLVEAAVEWELWDADTPAQLERLEAIASRGTTEQ